MNANFEAQLIECLDALEQGASVETLLTRYPDRADQLRPALMAARALSRIRVAPRPAAESASRQQFLERAAALRTQSRFTLPRRALLPAFGALVTAFSLLVLLGLASLSARPGDALYAAKRTGEQAQLLLMPLEPARADLREAFNQRRIEEIKSLLASRIDARVDFDGTLEAAGGGYWKIAGLTVWLDSGSRVTGSPQIGQRVHIEAITAQGRLIARTVTLDPDSPPPASTLTPSPVPSTSTPPPQIVTTPIPIPIASPGEEDHSGGSGDSIDHPDNPD
jgi:hypothetical protein